MIAIIQIIYNYLPYRFEYFVNNRDEAKVLAVILRGEIISMHKMAAPNPTEF